MLFWGNEAAMPGEDTMPNVIQFSMLNEVEKATSEEEVRNTALKQQKHGLMQQLLTGKLRMKNLA